MTYLIETCHADINLPDREGHTSLTEACLHVRTSVLMYLFTEIRDLDVNIANINGNTALHLAVWCNKPMSYAQLHLAFRYKVNMTRVLRFVYVRGHNISMYRTMMVTHLYTELVNMVIVTLWRLRC